MRYLYPRHTFRRFTFLLPPFILSVFYWAQLSGGFFRLDANHTLSDAQWWQITNLIRGDATLGNHGLGGDAMFNVRGETIAYWLPFPGIIRLLLMPLAWPFIVICRKLGIGNGFGQVYMSIPSVVLAYFVTMLSMVFLLKELFGQTKNLNIQQFDLGIRSQLFVILIVPSWFFFRWANVYVESISWAIAISLWAMVYFLKCQRDPSAKNYVKFSILIFLSFLTRLPEILISSCLVLFLYIKSSQNLRTDLTLARQRFLPLISLCLGAFTLSLINIARWGSPFTLVPLEKHIATFSDPVRLDRYMTYGNFYPKRFLQNLMYYWGFDISNFSSSFPWVKLSGVHDYFKAAGTMDYVEKKITVFPVMFALVIVIIYFVFQELRKLGMRNWKLWLKQLRGTPLEFAALCGISLLLFAPALAVRYTSEWFLFLAPLALRLFCRTLTTGRQDVGMASRYLKVDVESKFSWAVPLAILQFCLCILIAGINTYA